MLETVKFIYEHGYEFTGAISFLFSSAAGCYVVATWLRTTPDPIQIPSYITIHLEHHHFHLNDNNLPD